MKLADKLFFLLLCSLTVYLSLFLWSHRQIFFTPFDPAKTQERYFNSSYGRTRAQYILSDEELYVAEGYFLVGLNRDLHQLTPGHPPLGKYFIGLSIKFFNNPYFFSPVFGLLVLFLLYQTGRLLGLSPLSSLVITSLFSLEPLFTDQLITSLLDIYLLTFSLAGLCLYLHWLKRPRLLLLFLSQFFLGLSLATKFFPVGFPLLASLFLVTLFTGRFPLFLHHLFSLVFILFGFSLGHFTYFLHHPSLIELLKYQRYVLSWWAGSPQVPPFQVWDLIFFNRWHTWWGTQDIITTPFWQVIWPVLFTLALISIPLLFLKKNLPVRQAGFPLPILTLIFWLILSLLLFSFEAVYPRHLLIVLPAIYLLAGNLVLARRKLRQ